MRIALIRELFFEDDALQASLEEARAQGAVLAVLPELPFLPWRPAFETAVESDAEPMHGPSLHRLAEAARRTGVAVLGGAIVLHKAVRHNTALLVDGAGELRAQYSKLHLPSEPGFWEDRHYAPGDEPPHPVDGFPLRLGIQLCSDVNRPEGSHMLAAMGAEVLLCPRATEAATFDRWRLMLRANALSSCCYVLSVTRPRPEFDVPLGGPTIAIGPDGEVLHESEETVVVVDCQRSAVEAARRAYPGYLAVRPRVYAAGWTQAAR